jgi:hypothetical protein
VGEVYSQGYTDDIYLLAVGKFPNTVSGFIQWALGTVEAWCGELGLSVNPYKTRLVAFMRKRKLPGFFEPCLFRRILQCSMSIKYLGVILNSRLTWREHVDVRVRKAQNLLWACKRACGGVQGVGPGTQRGSLALCLCHQAVRHLCILSMVAWLSDTQCQGKTKQNPKIGLLRDNRGSAHHSNLCHGGTHLPPSFGVSGAE